MTTLARFVFYGCDTHNQTKEIVLTEWKKLQHVFIKTQSCGCCGSPTGITRLTCNHC